MNTALWIIQGILSAFFIYASLSKLLQTRDQQVKKIPEMTHVSALQIKLIGLAELLGAIGIIVPALIGILVILTPIAAVGLAIIMVCASIFHIILRSFKAIAFTSVVIVLALFVAYGRF